MRIGHGYDVHAFEQGTGIVLAGVHIEHTAAFKAHSDGDVAFHALCDALLGAAALGDIGHHFPDTDPQYKGIASSLLLSHVYQLLKNKSYKVINTDITIIAQAPKLAPYIDQMKNNIADLLCIDTDQVNVKATTTERLGYIGREEGVAVHAVALIDKVD